MPRIPMNWVELPKRVRGVGGHGKSTAGGYFVNTAFPAQRLYFNVVTVC